MSSWRNRLALAALAGCAMALLAGCSSDSDGPGVSSETTASGSGAGASGSSSSTGSGTGSSTGASGGGSSSSTTSGAGGGAVSALALVYRGPGTCDATRGGCAVAWAEMLQSCQPDVEIEYVGPDEAEDVSDASLARASIFVYPGGNDDLATDWEYVKAYKPALQAFVAAGGRYLGSCTGGYLAASNPWTGDDDLGFELLPADADEYITTPNAVPTTPDDTVTDVVWPAVWGGEPHPIYFQDGASFTIHSGMSDAVSVLATYASNGEIAALVAPFGAGKVGVEGPHAEAPEDWYTFSDVPGAPDFAPGCDLIARTLAP